MKTGTKSVLFGIHAFWLHPYYVRRAWGILYPKQPPTLVEWCAILTHDLGYWGCTNMDGEDGQSHPGKVSRLWERYCGSFGKEVAAIIVGHSRFYASRDALPLSRLYAPDKLASALYPLSLYMALGRMSGEMGEYIARFKVDFYGFNSSIGYTDEQVILEIQSSLARQALEYAAARNRQHVPKYPWPSW